MEEGTIGADGGWIPNEGSMFRRLTKREVDDLTTMAESTTPTFGLNDASWEQHHPLCREIWERRGLKP